jgi:homoserine dehydrogenase
VGVALLGFGTVGRSVARILCEGRHPSLRLRAVCTRRAANVQRDAPWVPSDVVWTTDFDEAMAAGATVVVELIGGLDPARAWIVSALAAGRSVVTANKQVMAEHGAELVELARARGCSLRFEGTVGGGTPVVCGLRDGLSADRITRIAGVVNGTNNFVLTRMERDGVPLSDAVAEAQALGFAEADPSADLDGLDARAKLALLVTLGFGLRVHPADVATRSTRIIEPTDVEHAALLGRSIRQVAWAERVEGRETTIRALVTPALVLRASSLASLEGPRNAVCVRGDRSGETVFLGQGAGGDATAVAVVSDLLGTANAPAPPHAWPSTVATVLAGLDVPHYVRVSRSPDRDQPDPAVVLDRFGIRMRVRLTAQAGQRDWAAVVRPCCAQRLADAAASLVPPGDADAAAICLPLIDVE